MYSDESLDNQFFAAIDEFGRLSSIDPSKFGPNSVDTWMNDNSSPFCLLCKENFHPLLRRRHHCRYCGLLLCGSCTSHKTIVGDSFDRVCDACAVTLLPPNISSAYPGLKKWSSSSIGLENYQKSPKSAGIIFLCTLLTSENIHTHIYAINALYKLSRCHATSLISSGTAKFLLNHSATCQCEAVSLSLELFVTLFTADPQGCKIEFHLSPFNLININNFFLIDNLEMKRATSRLLYLLITQNKYPYSSLSEIFNYISYPDPWVSSFLIASIAYNLPHINIFEIENYEINENLKFPNQINLIPFLINIFNPKFKNSCLASRYFSSIILEFLSHFDEELNVLAHNNLEFLVQSIIQFCPKNSNDDRIDSYFSVLLSFVLLRVWKKVELLGSPEELLIPLFSCILLPIFEILGHENKNIEKSYLSLIQKNAILIIGIIGKHNELKSALISEQMILILTNFTKLNNELSEISKNTLNILDIEI